jgi:hypothetical protein
MNRVGVPVSHPSPFRFRHPARHAHNVGPGPVAVEPHDIESGVGGIPAQVVVFEVLLVSEQQLVQVPYRSWREAASAAPAADGNDGRREYLLVREPVTVRAQRAGPGPPSLGRGVRRLADRSG